VAVLAAVVLTGTGLATMADAVSAAPAPAPKVPSSQPAAPVPTDQPTADPRTAELTRSVDDLLAQLGSLQLQIDPGGATAAPTTDPTVPPSGGPNAPTQDPPTQGASTGPEQEPSDG
jgi:hypothetical protein